jgi:hypothetical protein
MSMELAVIIGPGEQIVYACPSVIVDPSDDTTRQRRADEDWRMERIIRQRAWYDLAVQFGVGAILVETLGSPDLDRIRVLFAALNPDFPELHGEHLVRRIVAAPLGDPNYLTNLCDARRVLYRIERRLLAP